MPETAYQTQADVTRCTEAYCAANPTWRPIYALTDERDYAPIPWRELPGWIKRPWRNRFRESAKDAWEEFGTNKPTFFRTGFVSGDGSFFSRVRDIPKFSNVCMVIEVGGERGIFVGTSPVILCLP